MKLLLFIKFVSLFRVTAFKKHVLLSNSLSVMIKCSNIYCIQKLFKNYLGNVEFNYEIITF